MLLQNVCKDMANVQEETALWATHVGKNVHHHSGWLPMVQASLHVLGKAAEEGRQGSRVQRSGVLVLGVGAAKYSPMEFNKHFERSWVIYGAVGGALRLLQVPRTCREWKQGVEHATRLARDAGASTWTRNPYLWPWLLRSYLLRVARLEGVDRMEVDQDLTVDDIQGMCPDQNAWARRFAPHTMKVQDMFDATGYDGPPELFTMYACLFMSCAEKKVDPDWVWQHRAEMIRKRTEFEQEHGLAPHPLELVKYCGAFEQL